MYGVDAIAINPLDSYGMAMTAYVTRVIFGRQYCEGATTSKQFGGLTGVEAHLTDAPAKP